MRKERDITRLPVWVQDHIHGLEMQIRNLTTTVEELSAGPEASNTFAEPHFPGPSGSRPLGMNTEIRFGGLGHDNTFDVRYDNGELSVRASSRWDQEMIIKPRVSNAFIVSFGLRS